MQAECEPYRSFKVPRHAHRELKRLLVQTEGLRDVVPAFCQTLRTVIIVSGVAWVLASGQ